MILDRVIAVRNSKTVYRDGENCIKVFDRDYSKADILNEALNQARIEETGLHVPRIKEVLTIDGKWAIVSEYVKGKTLSGLMAEHPENKGGYLELLVDLQTEVHSKSCPLLTGLKDKMNRKIDAAELDATTKHDLHTRLEGMPEHHKVCHGDFNPSNVVIAGDGTPYILDWAHVTQGNASADAACTYLLFRLNGDPDGAREYLDLFLKKSGTEKRDVEKWIPIVAASRSVRGNEKERRLLLSLVNTMGCE